MPESVDPVPEPPLVSVPLSVPELVPVPVSVLGCDPSSARAPWSTGASTTPVPEPGAGVGLPVLGTFSPTGAPGAPGRTESEPRFELAPWRMFPFGLLLLPDANRPNTSPDAPAWREPSVVVSTTKLLAASRPPARCAAAAASRCWRSSMRDRSPLLAAPGTPRNATKVLPTVSSRKNDPIKTPVVPRPAMYARDAFRVDSSCPKPNVMEPLGCLVNKSRKKLAND